MWTRLGSAWRRLFIGLALATVSGCGVYAASAPPPAQPVPSAATAFAASPPPPTPQAVEPSVAASSPAVVAVPPPAPPPPMPPVAAAATGLHFPLLPVDQPVNGEVIITPMPGAYRLHVQASGLAPDSLHSVHLHFGNCPNAGVHIAVLGVMAADAGGHASLSLALGVPYRGGGRFVIIYAGPSVGPLAACAQLSG